MEKSRKKNIRIIIVAFIVVCLVIITYSIIHYILISGKVKVKIFYAPLAATVVLDGEEVANDSERYISVGSHSVSVKYPNFEDLEENIEVGPDTEYLFGILAAMNSKAELYVKEHINEFMKAEGIAGLVDSAEGAKKRTEILDNYPIVAKLPVVNSLFEIKYIEQAEGDISFVINAPNTYIDSAVQKMQSLALADENLANYDINFEGFDNLLANSFIENSNSDPIDFLTEGFKNVTTFQFVEGEYVDNYYCALVTTGREQEYSLATYRIILVKNGNWTLASQPLPILTKYNSSEVPIEVLSIANSM